MTDYAGELRTEREMKDRFMARHPESPFVAEGVPGFEGLKYFPIDEGYRVRATLDRLPTPAEAFLRTNRDGQSVVRHLGDLAFRLSSKTLHLRLYHAGEGIGTSVFVPFRDRTSGRESYGPGRYLTLELTPDDVYELDFNRAFNPYCAYTDAFECGFPPSENDLPIAVRAGEKVWSTERNPASPEGAVRSLLPPSPRKAAKARTSAQRRRK
ncbi:MAG: DUF1684 domain-containing protein [Thermoplasmata archaeon]|nr:DUF1684 domain-containing protein [Thermoplasmata archaeon]